MNDYYDPLLKENRSRILLDSLKFKFEKIVISHREIPGIRNSLPNLYAYVDSNLIGFLNIIELYQQNSVERLIYASSSSVYCANDKLLFNIEDRVIKPMSLYAATKMHRLNFFQRNLKMGQQALLILIILKRFWVLCLPRILILVFSNLFNSIINIIILRGKH